MSLLTAERTVKSCIRSKQTGSTPRHQTG